MNRSAATAALRLGSLLLAAAIVWGQFPGTQLFRESFAFGPTNQRPKSGKGRMTNIFLNMSISGFWVENPSNRNTTWMTLDGSGVQGWTWAAASPNPYEAPTPLDPTGTNNGIAWCQVDPGAAFEQSALLAPFPAPTVKFSVSGDLMPRPIVGQYTALGLTYSNALQDNFESAAAVWVRLRMNDPADTFNGVAEFHIYGLAGPTVSAAVPVTYNGFNHTEIIVDPVALRATATVNGVPLGTLRIPAAAPRYVGFEGSGGADNLVVVTVP